MERRSGFTQSRKGANIAKQRKDFAFAVLRAFVPLRELF
jgi:hypothetical protein